MTCFCINSDQYRVVPFILLLQGRHEFKGMCRNDPVIMIGSKRQGCRVVYIFPDIMQGRIFEKIIEPFLSIACTVIAGPGMANSELLVPQHIHYSNLGYRHFHQVGPLGHHGSDKESPV